jgi:hypothetical protein
MHANNFRRIALARGLLPAGGPPPWPPGAGEAPAPTRAPGAPEPCEARVETP